MYVEEIAMRTGRQFEAAKKTEKYAHVRLFNDDLLSGFVKVQRGSPLEQELMTLPRDPDWPDPAKPDAPPKEDSRFPNHCADASLYSYRRCWHYLHTDEVKKPQVGTKPWFDAEAKRMEEIVLARVKRNASPNWMLGDDAGEDYYDEGT